MREKETLQINEQNVQKLAEEIVGRVSFQKLPPDKNGEITYASADETYMELSTEGDVDSAHPMKAHIQRNTAVELCTNEQLHIALMAGKQASGRGFVADVFPQGLKNLTLIC